MAEVKLHAFAELEGHSVKSGLCSHETASPSPVYAPVTGSWATRPLQDGSSACQLREADQNRLDSEPGEMSAATTRSVAATAATGPAASANASTAGREEPSRQNSPH